MDKNDIASIIIDAYGGTLAKANMTAQGIVESMVRTLERGGEVSLAGFGKFKPSRRNARSARNPRTGEAVTVPERNVVRFHPSLVLKKRINQ